MGLIIVKHAGEDAEYFTKAIEATRGIITNAHFGLVTIKKGLCLNVNNQNLKDYNYDLPGVNFVRDDDAAVATFIHMFKEDEGNKAPKRNVPAVFEYDTNGITFSTTGDLFITTSHQYHFYFDEGRSRTFNEYLHNIVSDEVYLNMLEHGKFEKVINYGPGIANAARCVLGNIDGIYIFGEHNFSQQNGLLYSVPFMGDRITSLLGDKKTPKKKHAEQSIARIDNTRGIYYREKREIISRIHEIFFHRKYHTLVPFHNREKFVIMSYDSDPYNDEFELMSLRTGDITMIRFFDLRHLYKGYYFKKLHNGTASKV